MPHPALTQDSTVRALVALLVALPAPSFAADVDFFVPAGSLVTGRGTLQGESPFLGPTGFSGGILAGYADDPVVRTGSDGTVTPEVDLLVPIHLQGSWTQADLIRVDVMLPVYAVVDAPLADHQGPAVGDLRLQATVPLASDERFGLSLVPRVELPTGSDGALVSGGLAAGLVAALGGRTGRLGWNVAPGIHLASNEPLEVGGRGVGSRASVVGGAWWSVSDAVRFGAEADLAVGLAPGDGGTNNTSMAHGFAQVVLPSGLGLTAGGGTGLLAGLGTPRYRVFGALTWTTLRRDQDRDGIVDGDDACPEVPEDLDAFEDLDGCPDPDNDGDSIVDVEDECPDSAEDLDGTLDEDGCLDEDNDGDGLADVVDSCPDDVGTEALVGCPDTDADGIPDNTDRCPTAFGVAAFQGCSDTDGDGIPDDRDECPSQPRPASESLQTSDGCPKAVFVTEREIEIDQRVEFETGKGALLASSHAVLDQVAAALAAAPHVMVLEVQGHTDSVGAAGTNLRLSQARAESVVAYLMQKGVSAERLVAQGYGETTPLYTNRTASGREANRRVQFVVLDVIEPTAEAP